MSSEFDDEIEYLSTLPAPEAIASEKVILGAVLLDFREFDKFKDDLQVEDFYIDSHRRIYRAMLEMREDNQAIDLITLTNHLSLKMEVSTVGGVAYMSSLTEGLPRQLSHVLRDHAKLVADKRVRRNLRAYHLAAARKAYSGEEWGVDMAADFAKDLRTVQEQTNYPWVTRTRRQVLVDAMDFAGVEAKPVDWAITNLVQRGGNGLILAAPKTGKSLLMADMAIHLASGTPWLGQYIPRRMVTALVSREDHHGLTSQRISSLVNGTDLDTKNLTDYLWLNTRAQTDTFSLEKKDDVDEIIESFLEKKVEFAVFDVFRRLWNGNENESDEVATALAALTRIQTSCGCALALVHHVNKSEGGIFQRTRGSSAIDGWSEWGFGITNDTGGSEEEATKKIEFYTKAAAAHASMNFRIAERAGGIRIERCQAPEPAKKAGMFPSKKKKEEPQQPKIWEDKG